MNPAIRVDDTDPNIQYTGSWVSLPVTSIYDNLGDNGQPFQNTLHSANSQASLTYNFTGHTILVAGTIPSANVAIYPSFSCSIDGEAFQKKSSLQPGNGMTLCEVDNLLDGLHTLEFRVESPNDGSLLFDYIQYAPSSEITPDDRATVVIQYSDPQLQSAYDKSWYTVAQNTSSSAIQRIGSATKTTNSTFKFLFNGTALSWYGFYDGNYPSASTKATYSIDDQSAIQFPVRGTSNGSQLSQLIVRISTLPQKQHELVVIYEGNNDTTPLTLETLVVENGSISGRQLQQHVSPSSSAQANPPTSTIQQTQAPSIAVNAIVGGVIGGLAIILFGIFACLLLRIRAINRGHKAASAEFIPHPIPYTTPSPPFIRTPSMHKERPPPPRYMPPLSNAGSMRSYDPPSTEVPNVSERRSSARRHRDSTINSAAAKKQTRPKARSKGPSQTYVTLNALDTTEDGLKPGPPPEPPTSPAILT